MANRLHSFALAGGLCLAAETTQAVDQPLEGAFIELVEPPELSEVALADLTVFVPIGLHEAQVLAAAGVGDAYVHGPTLYRKKNHIRKAFEGPQLALHKIPAIPSQTRMATWGQVQIRPRTVEVGWIRVTALPWAVLHPRSLELVDAS